MIQHTKKLFKPVTLLLAGIALFFAALIAGCDEKQQARQGEALIQFIEQTQNLPAAKRGKALDSLFTVALNRGNDSLTRVMLSKIAWHYSDLNNSKKFYSAAKAVYERAAIAKDTPRMALGLYYLGDYYDQQRRPDSTLYYYLRSEKMFTAINNKANAARAMQNGIGVLYHNGSYAEAEAKAIKALKLYQEINDSELIFDAYVTLSLTLTDMKDYDKAREYFKLVFSQIDKLEKEGHNEEDIRYFRASAYNNMGIMYQSKQEYKKALALYNKGLAVPNLETSKPAMYAMLLSNRGTSKLLLDQNQQGIKEDLWKALRIRDSLDLKAGIIASKVAIGRYFLMKKDTASGLHYIKQAYHGAKAIESSADVVETLSILSVSDHANRSYYSNLYFKVNDSLQQAERATRNKFARIAYETERVESENKLLSRRFTYMLVAFAILLVLIFGLLIIVRLKAKNKELLHNQRQQHANEKIYMLLLRQEAEAENAKTEERNRLAMELHDGVLNRIFTTRFNLMQLETPQEDKKQLLVQELQETQDEIRKLSHNLKESFLVENESFGEALKQLVAKQQEADGLVFDVFVDKFINWTTVALENRVALFRIVQESCTNAKKHSAAAHCHIALMAQGEMLKLRIWDDGQGFDPKKVKEGIGMRNISDRIKALGGTFNFSASPGKGAVLEVIV